MESRRKRNARLKLSYRWHRRIGVILAAPLLLLASTGLALNHHKQFGLDEIRVRFGPLLDWYNIQPATTPTSVSVASRWITVLESVLYIDSQRVAERVSELVTGVQYGQELLVIATSNELLLFTREPLELVERLDRSALPPGNIKNIGTTDDRLIVDTEMGQFSFDQDIAEYRVENSPIPLSRPVYADTPQDIRSAVITEWRSHGISAWKVILDLHTGRIFGLPGTFITDLAALCIVLLVATGLYNYKK